MTQRISGVGLGLRRAYAQALFAEPPERLAFLELHPENYLERGGVYRRLLEQARERFPLLTHGLTFGVGRATRYPTTRLRQLAEFVRDTRSPIHSDHLCFAEADGRFAHDLLPLPRTEESVAVCVARITELSDAIGQPIAIEPISFYLEAPHSTLTDQQFLCEVLSASDASLLLDVNNVFVNSQNHGFDPYAYIASLPLERVVQLHVAGHETSEAGLLIDTHAAPICEQVFALTRYTLERLARPIPVLLERDDNFPAYGELVAEFERLAQIYDDVLGGRG